MPSKSPAQHRLMEAGAHTAGGYDGVPQKVGKDFVAADRHAGSSPKSPDEHMAKRRAQGLTYREVAGEQGVSKSTAHRKVMRQGFSNLGRAG